MTKMYKLRDYQVEGSEFLQNHMKCILADSPGLGKSLQVIDAILTCNIKDVLIVAPKVAKSTWTNELNKFAPHLTCKLIQGTPKKREKQWLENTNVTIVNPQQLAEVFKFKKKWSLIVVDEFHNGFINRNNKTFKDFKKLSSDRIWLVSATPMRNNMGDWFTSLNIMDKKTFSSYWSFVNKYATVKDCYWGGKDISRTPKNKEMFKSIIDQFMIQRKRETVLADLPTKSRQLVSVEMTKEQKRSYKELSENMMLDLEDDMIITTTVLTQILKLRQMCISPQSIGIDDVGGMIPATYEVLSNYIDNDQPVSIALPFKAPIPYIKEYFKSKYKDLYIEEIHGDVKDSSSDVANRWENDKRTKKLLIYTIQSGFSFSIPSSWCTVFMGSTYSFVELIQAEDRSLRLTTTHPIDIIYITCENTVDEDVVKTFLEKGEAIESTISGKEIALNFFKNKLK